jgi:hypothetical protein
MRPVITVRVHVESPNGGLSRSDRLSILRGQITLLRHRCEEEIPITVEAMAGAERIARSLELDQVMT